METCAEQLVQLHALFCHLTEGVEFQFDILFCNLVYAMSTARYQSFIKEVHGGGIEHISQEEDTKGKSELEECPTLSLLTSIQGWTVAGRPNSFNNKPFTACGLSRYR